MSNQKRIFLMVSMGKELREKIQKLAKSKGLTAAGYTRSLLIQKLEEEAKRKGKIYVP